MKTALAIALALATGAVHAAEPTFHMLTTTWNDSNRGSTNWFIPSGYRAEIVTLSRVGGDRANVLEFDNDVLSGLALLQGMVVNGPGRLYAASRPTGSGAPEHPQQLAVVKLTESPAPTLARVERSVDLTNWIESAKVWLPHAQGEPAAFYRLTVER